MSPRITTAVPSVAANKSASVSKSASASKTVVEEPVVVPVVPVVVPVVPGVVPVPVVPVVVAVVPATFDLIMEKVTAIGQYSKELSAMMKIYNKEVAKSKTKSGKKEKVKKSTTNADGTPRPPSGFAVPTKLSVELCNFLTVAEETMMSRTEVTRHLNAYIKEKNLQNPANKKEILPDACLKKLLNVDDSIVLSYFNLQKYMKHLFVSTKK
jgi:hypothetical protein